MTTYYKFNYDGQAGGSFTPKGANLTWAGGVGFIITDVDTGTDGKLYIGLVSGTPPGDNVTVTQGGVTALVNEPIAPAGAKLVLYPAYFRDDVSVAANGDIAWTGPALGATHSFLFDGQTANVVVGEILTFSGGAQAEVITVVSDAGASGELDVRMITNLDTVGLPLDNETFTGDIAGDGTVNGLVHPRAYSALELHRFLSDLNDDEDIAGDDDLSMVDPTASDRSTDQIITLLGTINMSDIVSQHMYGGSVAQAGGDTLFSGLDVQVTTPLATTQPVLIQNDAIITDYWSNAYMPDSIAGAVRILVKTREDGVDIDGKRVTGKLLEFGESYFTGSTTLGQATTALALFSSPDGNNNTAVGTVAGAPYNTVVLTEGYQTLDFNNGNGATPFGLSIDFGTASSLQTYERTKYIQRRGTAELINGRNAQLFVGINLNWDYDTEAGGPYSEDEILAWGTVITYSGQTTNFSLGEVIDFSPSGAKGRLIYYDDNVATGTLIVALEPGINPTIADTMSGVTSGGDGAVDTVDVNSVFGTAVLIALDDQGATGNLYTQLASGLPPVAGQAVLGSTSNASSDVTSAPQTRTINNQFVGVYTGANFQTNFGIAIDPSDAIVGDLFPNLLGVNQSPPNNQQGVVGGLTAGDRVSVYPWDGTTTDVNGNAEPDFDEMTLAVALTAGVSTVVNVGAGNIPENTPASGFLRIERDSDNNVALVEYASQDGDDEFTLVGTSPITAAISNTVMRAFIDVVTATTSESYTAVKGVGDTQVAITVRRGSNSPIKTFKGTATFGSTGFNVNAQRISDA